MKVFRNIRNKHSKEFRADQSFVRGGAHTNLSQAKYIHCVTKKGGDYHSLNVLFRTKIESRHTRTITEQMSFDFAAN